MNPVEPTTDVISIGTHTVFITDDVLWLKPCGMLELLEMEELFRRHAQVHQRYGYTLTLIDATKSTGISASARRRQAELVKERTFPSHTAIYGASHLVRTAASLTIRAIELVTGRKTPVSFHRDEASAREQLGRSRVEILQLLKK